MLVVRLLGGLSVESTSGPLPAAAHQRRRLSLLAVLAVAGPRGLSRERIQAYLWPESSAARARHTLDQLVYATRRDLGSDSIASSANDLRLDSATVRADVWAFDDAIREARWEDAVGWYTGPLLQGLHLANCAELERWIDAERARREQDHLGALDALARAASRRGDVAEAVRWRRRQSAADPFSVAIALDTIRALEAAGDRAGAIQHARTYQQLVTTSLEIEPDPSVAALAMAVAARGGHVPRDASIAGSTAPTPSEHTGGRPTSEPGFAAPLRFLSARATSTRPWIARIAGAIGLVLSGVLVIALTALSQKRESARTTHASPSAPQPNDVGTARPNQTADPEARSLYLRARASWEKRTKERLDEAVVLFRRATDRDPGFAAAYAGLAQSYAMLGYFGFASGDAMFPKARAAAMRALELDPAAGDAYSALGQALAWQHDWTEAEVAYRRALELTPEDATAHQWYALLLAYLGRAREAAVHTGHASQLDPLSVQVNNMHGMMLYYAGDLGGALRQYERTVDAEPDSGWVRRNPWVLTNFSRVAAAAGRRSLAVTLVERALVVLPSHPRPLFDLAYAYASATNFESARAAFARADSSHAHYAMYRALLHGLVGEHDEAFAWFERVVEWPLPSLVTMNCEPRLAPLRADPRFEKVRARLGMSAP
jgi:DNA-binding SARP family transcriptional activator/Flp pilus assembly protein TadD